jgi:signal transduction histidine kinase
MRWHAFSAFDVDKVVEILLYNFVALVLGVLRDRERKEEKRALEAQSLAAVGKAVSALAHDMKTPLIAIGGFSRLVKRHLREDHPHRDKMDIIIAETMRLENMVKDMLDFSRPLELKLMAVNVALLIDECIEILDDAAKEKNVQVNSQAPPELSTIQVDPMRIKQAIINLLMNSIQASPQGEIVIVSCYQEGGECVIDVSDCGCGIPLERREEIFTPFFTTKKEGTGLGLPIVRKIIEAHHGSVQVIDNGGRGVTFRIIIPANVEVEG